MFDRILVLTDRTSDSKFICSYLPTLLESARSEVIVAEAVPFVETLLEMPLQFSLPSRNSDISGAEADVRRTVARLRARGIRARGIARLGSGVELVEQIARKETISLVALSARPLLGAWNRLWTTLAETILEKTRLPLFLANVTAEKEASSTGWEDLPPRPRIRKILIPMAGNPASRRAVEVSIDLARRLGGTLVLEALMGAETFDWRTLLHLNRGLKLCEHEHIPAERRVATGDPTAEILDSSRNGSVDLITLTSRLVPPSSTMSTGRIARQVLLEAKVPVLVTRRSAVGF